jgi:DNA-binding transcriptional ArsR family regulator
MSSDLTLATRARVHAALGDPTRLAVVDALALGDLSPGALAQSLGIASNLLAHHLKALEAAGLLARVRSESDRRRVYLQLERGMLGALRPVPRRAAERVVFV